MHKLRFILFLNFVILSTWISTAHAEATTDVRCRQKNFEMREKIIGLVNAELRSEAREAIINAYKALGKEPAGVQLTWGQTQLIFDQDAFPSTTEPVRDVVHFVLTGLADMPNSEDLKVRSKASIRILYTAKRIKERDTSGRLILDQIACSAQVTESTISLFNSDTSKLFYQNKISRDKNYELFADELIIDLKNR